MKSPVLISLLSSCRSIAFGGVVCSTALLSSVGCNSDGSPPAPNGHAATPAAAEPPSVATRPAEPTPAEPAPSTETPPTPANSAQPDAPADAAAPTDAASADKPAAGEPTPTGSPTDTRQTAAKTDPASDPGAQMKFEKDPKRGTPQCRHVGTRSEQWSWPDGERIDWAKCDKVTPECKHVGSKSEGWYADDKLIVFVRCSEA